MAAKNYLSDFQIFSKLHGCASKHPKLKDLLLSNHLMPHNLFFQHTAAFFFQAATVATGDAVVWSLWNGLDSVAGADGQATCVFDPGFAEPTGAVKIGVMPIVTLIGNDRHTTTLTFTQAANFTTQCVIQVQTGAGAPVSGAQGWALFIGKRAHWKHTVATPVSGKVYDGDGPAGENFQTTPLIGGTQVD